MNLNNLGSIIRLPFEIIGTLLYWVLDNLIIISIIIGSMWFCYWMFSSGLIKRISEGIVKVREESKSEKTIEESNIQEVKTWQQ